MQIYNYSSWLEAGMN